MQTSIDLQDPFIYSFIPLMIVFFIGVIMTCYLIYMKMKSKKLNVQIEKRNIPKSNAKNILEIKGRYLTQLDAIEDKYRNNIIELRKAYQLISECIRLFVYEVTDITTQNYSLTEIKELNIPSLYELIKEYYEPEFASKSVGDFNNSINKARGVINRWN